MKKIIHSNKAPKAVGPYSQAILTGNTLYVSGQIPLDPDTGEMENNDINIQTKRVLKNLEAILTEACFTR